MATPILLLARSLCSYAPSAKDDATVEARGDNEDELVTAQYTPFLPALYAMTSFPRRLA